MLRSAHCKTTWRQVQLGNVNETQRAMWMNNKEKEKLLLTKRIVNFPLSSMMPARTERRMRNLPQTVLHFRRNPSNELVLVTLFLPMRNDLRFKLRYVLCMILR